MKYSVIIPIYNAAPTIERCLDSLLPQLRDDAEILLINDGSTDAGGEICKCYARQHGGVRYFEKENGGVSSARNLGLEKAAGEYILFVDSDDYVTEDYFAVIDKAMDRWDPDMLMFGLQCFGMRKDIWQTGNFRSQDDLVIAKFVQKASYAYLYSNLMTRTFRREIIRAKNLRFDEALLVGEDQAFIFAYTMHVKHMVSIENVIYLYSRESADTLSQRNRAYLTEHLLRMSSLMQDALQTSCFTGRVRRIYTKVVSWVHYRGAYSACKELQKFGLTARERRAQIRQICEIYKDAGVEPADFRTWLIAQPVAGKMSWVVDGMSSHSEFYRKLIQK